MSIEVKVVGTNAEQIEKELLAVCRMLGIEGEASPASIDIIDLDTLVKVTEARLKGQGFEMTVMAVSDKPKRGRRPKLSPEDAAAALADTEELADDEPSDLQRPVLEAQKTATISRLTKLYYEPGGAAIVNGLLKKYGNGEKSFRNLPHNVFENIAKELDDADGRRSAISEGF